MASLVRGLALPERTILALATILLLSAVPVFAGAEAGSASSRDEVPPLGEILASSSGGSPTRAQAPLVVEWREMTPERSPAERASAMAYVPESDRIVLFGGKSLEGGSEVEFDDVWALCLPARTALDVELLSPFNYAAIPGGTEVSLAILGSGVTAVEYAVDEGASHPLESPYTIDTSSWSDGTHVLGIDLWNEKGLALSKRFVFFLDPEAAWPPDSVPVDVVLVGFEVPSEGLTSRLRTSYSVTTEIVPDVRTAFDLRFDFRVTPVSESYHRAFLDSLTQKAIFTDSLQARLNLTSLIDHRDNGTPRDIFDPLIGWELRTEWVEQYLEALPPLPPRAEPGYTLYLMNLSAFDDPLAGVDHWFVEPTPDPDTLQDQDWWRLEWDNDLNTPMGYPLNIWGGPAYQVFVDPTAYQWYQDWFYLWFQGGNERAPFGLQYEEVPVASRLDYLAGVVNDLIEGLAATLPSAPPQERGMEIRTFVLSGSLDHSLDDLRWIVSDLALESYLEGFLPFKEWEMNTTVALVADYPELRAVVDSHTTFDGNWGFIDGAAIFDYLNQNRELYVPDDPEVFEVLTMNFLYNNRSMVFSDREFTGLGGDGITVIFLKTDRLFYADGTRQKGLTSLIAHETGHNLGYGHQFGPNWRADFVNGNMGYFRNDLEYGRFWEDALHRVYVREKLLILLALLDGREPLDLAPEFPSFYQHYKELDLLTAYSDLVEIEGMLTDSVPPAAEAGPSLTVEEDTSILLNGGASTDNFRIHTYSWDFGDGTTFSASEPTVVKIWNDPGVYPVTLTVYDAAGNQDTDVLFATVLDITPPVISILSPSSGTLLATSEVEVTWAAVDEGLGLDRIEVRLDAGAPAVVTPPVSSHTFMAVADGHHLLTVTAIDEARNRASVSASFRVETAGSAFVAPSVTWSLVAAAVTASVGVGYVLYRRYIRRRAPGERPRTPPE